MNKKLKVTLLCSLFILLLFFLVLWLRFVAFIIDYEGPFAKQDIMISPLYLGYIITLISLPIAYLLGMGRSKKSKYRIWGIAIMLLFSLPLAYSIGITYSLIVGSPWATMLLFYVFPVIFIVGLILLLVGVFKKGVLSQ
ncbi:hypothetical protein [Oceanobacillus iheyensis HTE831]|uniref:Uncharacterized protein n=1 Tax=Oceanobacillus iheyensis (strain DSM 14371 / CIP 107618 / JCM 11309 / KCTC 3954 / HTE831) TaxID=221109 RepID=Q8ERQ6_OCEIH|nr:hypothetical protein [Oceanobacillus iheyensis]BAC13201.1 hypothetical protein [Oceanobacillus iheyensis HTE831]